MRRKLLVGLLVLFAVAWGWIALRPSAMDELDDLVAELRARGEPVTLAEVDGPLPPDDQNGAREIEAAIAWLDANQSNVTGWSSFGRSWSYEVREAWLDNATPEQQQSMWAFLESLEPVFELLDAAAEKPVIAWPPPSLATPAEVLDQRSAVRDLLRFPHLLEKRALAARSETERLRAIRSLLGIASGTRTRGNMDKLFPMAWHHSACRSLRIGLTRGSLDPSAARLALDEHLREDWGVRLPRTIRDARAGWLAVAPLWLDGSMQAEIAARSGPPPSFSQRLQRQFDALVRGRPTGAAGFEWDPDHVRELDRFLVPGGSAAADADPSVTLGPLAEMISGWRTRLLECDSVARLARVSLAAYEHRRLHGEWPASPNELAPLFPDGVPHDPFTDEAFVFERDTEDFEVLLVRSAPRTGPFLLAPSSDFVWRLPPR